MKKPSTFLWVLRALITAFLLGYVMAVYSALFIAEFYPTGDLVPDLAAVGLFVLFGLGYFLMWIRWEVLAGSIFILWYASLWGAELVIGGDTFEDAPVPGVLMFILAALLLAYRFNARKKTIAERPEA